MAHNFGLVLQFVEKTMPNKKEFASEELYQLFFQMMTKVFCDKLDKELA